MLPLVRLAEFAAPHKGFFAVSVVLAIAGVASGMVPYYALSHIVIHLIRESADISVYMDWCLLAAAGILGKIVFHNLSTLLSHRATFSVISEIRYRIVEKLAKVSRGYTLNTPSGKLKNTIVEKVDSIEPALAHVLPEMTSNLLAPLGIVVYIFTIDWRMALVSLLTLPVGFLCFLKMNKNYKARFHEYTNAQKHMNAVSVEYVNGIEVIKTFNQSAASYRRFTDAVTANARIALDWIKDVQFYFAIGLGVWPAVLIGVLPMGCLFHIQGTLTTEDFITVTVLSLGIIAPLLAVMFYTDDLAKIGSIVDDIAFVLDEPELIRPKEPAVLDSTDIRFWGVGFSYLEKPVLKDVNLFLPAGTVTALVGPSGSGKSTIAKLIASFWDVSKGRITLGGMDIRRIPLEQLMAQIAFVSQDNYLFDDTIRNNIRMGRPGASNLEVEAAARDSGCHRFIMDLEHGFDTVAGGDGGHLSGGERQRIAIARAMLKNAPVVILDEATAFTDPENEAMIQRAVARLVAGKTLIVIAHRLSTITNSDKIVVVDRGRIQGEGSHEELLEKNALYLKMWQAHAQTKDRTLEGEAP